jgi:hypothetical protein
MKLIGLSLFIVLFITACTPHVGIGIGSAATLGNGSIGVSEVHINESGVHGSVGVGTDINL